VFIESDVPEHAEPRQIILVGIERAVPGGDVERRVVLSAVPEASRLAGDNGILGVMCHGNTVPKRAVEVRGRDLEVPDVCQARRTYRAQVWQAEMPLEELADIAAAGS
jgi:hypothetical protein